MAYVKGQHREVLLHLSIVNLDTQALDKSRKDRERGLVLLESWEHQLPQISDADSQVLP